MYWAFGFQPSPVEQLLDGGDFTLEQFLQEDDSLQEIKALNRRVIEYIQQAEVLRELVDIATGPVSADTEAAEEQKRVYHAAEILAVDVPGIGLTVVADEKMLDTIFAFLLLPEPQPLRATMAVRVIGSLLIRQPTELWQYLGKRVDFVARIAAQIEVAAVRDLLNKILAVQDASVPTADWLTTGNLIPLLISRLSDVSAEARTSAAQAMIDILHRYESVETSLTIALCTPQSSTAILHSALQGASSGIIILTTAIRRASLLAAKSSAVNLDRPEPATTIAAHSQTLVQVLTMREGERIGTIRVAVLELLAALVAVHVESVEAAVASAGLLCIALDVFFTHPWTNVVHGIVSSMIYDNLNAGRGLLFEQLLTSCALPLRIVNAVTQNTAYSQGCAGRRLGFMGHVLAITTVLENSAVEQASGVIANALSVTPQWDVASAAAEQARVAAQQPLGGTKPQSMTLDPEDEFGTAFMSSASSKINALDDDDFEIDRPNNENDAMDEFDMAPHAWQQHIITDQDDTPPDVLEMGTATLDEEIDK